MKMKARNKLPKSRAENIRHIRETNDPRKAAKLPKKISRPVFQQQGHSNL